MHTSYQHPDIRRSAKDFLRSVRSKFGRETAHRIASEHIDVLCYYPEGNCYVGSACPEDFLSYEHLLPRVDWNQNHATDVEADWSAAILEKSRDINDTWPQEVADDLGDIYVFTECGAARCVSVEDNNLADPEVQNQILMDLEDLGSLPLDQAVQMVLSSDLSDAGKISRLERLVDN